MYCELMKRKSVLMLSFLAALAVMVGSVPHAQACRPAPASILQHYESKAKVFVGTVRRGLAEEGVFELSVDESFKGLSPQEKRAGLVQVSFAKTMCGFQPKLGERFLVFMNDGDRVNQGSGSMYIWRESEQADAHLNPMIDKLLVLRRMLRFGKDPRIVPVPDEETAVHLAMKALIPVYGAAAVAQSKPFVAKFNERGSSPQERRWRVEGKKSCKSRSKKACGGTFVVEIDKWTGDVLEISALTPLGPSTDNTSPAP